MRLAYPLVRQQGKSFGFSFAKDSENMWDIIVAGKEEGTVSYYCEIKPGDRILTINGVKVTGMPLKQLEHHVNRTNTLDITFTKGNAKPAPAPAPTRFSNGQQSGAATTAAAAAAPSPVPSSALVPAPSVTAPVADPVHPISAPKSQAAAPIPPPVVPQQANAHADIEARKFVSSLPKPWSEFPAHSMGLFAAFFDRALVKGGLSATTALVEGPAPIPIELQPVQINTSTSSDPMDQSLKDYWEKQWVLMKRRQIRLTRTYDSWKLKCCDRIEINVARMAHKTLDIQDIMREVIREFDDINRKQRKLWAEFDSLKRSYEQLGFKLIGQEIPIPTPASSSSSASSSGAAARDISAHSAAISGATGPAPSQVKPYERVPQPPPPPQPRLAPPPPVHVRVPPSAPAPIPRLHAPIVVDLVDDVGSTAAEAEETRRVDLAVKCYQSTLKAFRGPTPTDKCAPTPSPSSVLTASSSMSGTKTPLSAAEVQQQPLVAVKLERTGVGFGEADTDEVTEVSRPGSRSSVRNLSLKRKLDCTEEPTAADDDEDDDGIEVVGVRVSIDLPHHRESCPVHIFDSSCRRSTSGASSSSPDSGAAAAQSLSVNAIHCPTCYCVICCSAASECPSWPLHCDATIAGVKATARVSSGHNASACSPGRRRALQRRR